MDQPLDRAPPETVDDIMDAVLRDDTVRTVERPGKSPVVVMSAPTYWRLRVPRVPELEACWAAAKEAGLDKMTMEEIDEEIAAARREIKAEREASR